LGVAIACDALAVERVDERGEGGTGFGVGDAVTVAVGEGEREGAGEGEGVAVDPMIELAADSGAKAARSFAGAALNHAPTSERRKIVPKPTRIERGFLHTWNRVLQPRGCRRGSLAP